MSKLDGKIVLITGGNSGIGLATAKEFVREDAYVFITGPAIQSSRRRSRKSAEVSRASKVTSRTSAISIASSHRSSGTRAGSTSCSRTPMERSLPPLAPLGQITEEHFDSLFDINVKGLLFTVQKALALMPDGASIITGSELFVDGGIAQV